MTITNRPHKKDRNLPAQMDGPKTYNIPDRTPLYIHMVVIEGISLIGVPACMEAIGLPVFRSSNEIFIIHDSSPTLSIGGKVVRNGRVTTAYRQIIASK
jgi:hypothetical protein